MENKKFFVDLQTFTAIAASGASALRGQKKGVIPKVRDMLGIINLMKGGANYVTRMDQ